MFAQIPPPPDTGYWVHDLDPILLRFPEGWPLDGIRWYGLAYVVGFAIAWGLLRWYFKKGRSPLSPTQQMDLLTAIIVGVIVGGRVGYYLFYRFDAFLADPLVLLKVWEGGMASHGGILGIVIALIWFARQSKTPFWQVADIAVTLGPPGVLLGRLANFVNGELYGRVAEVPWAMHFLDVRRMASGGLEYFWTPPVHPSQLYQAVLEGLILTIYLQVRFWSAKAEQRPAGQLAGEFFIGYAVLRVVGEVFREPDADLILGLSRGMFYSLFMVIAGAAIIWRQRSIQKTGTP